MDPWDHIRRAVADTRSGSVGVALRAARGLSALSARRDVMRASRALLRAHPSMAALWRLCATAVEDGPEAAAGFASALEEQTAQASDAVRWAVTGRRVTVITHSSSASVVAGLARVRSRVAHVLCTWSLPGGEGRALAKRLERDGYAVTLVPDAALASACARADVALVGADAVSDVVVVNKVGTLALALGAREAGIGCYAVASSAKLLPDEVRRATAAPLFDATPLALFDAVVTESGPRRPGAVRRAAARITIPAELLGILPSA